MGNEIKNPSELDMDLGFDDFIPINKNDNVAKNTDLEKSHQDKSKLFSDVIGLNNAKSDSAAADFY